MIVDACNKNQREQQHHSRAPLPHAVPARFVLIFLRVILPGVCKTSSAAVNTAAWPLALRAALPSAGHVPLEVLHKRPALQVDNPMGWDVGPV